MVSSCKSPHTRDPPHKYSPTLSSLMGIWDVCRERRGKRHWAPHEWSRCSGDTDGGQVQGVGRGVPLGKAAAELAACTQGKAGHLKVVTSVSDLHLHFLLSPLPPAAHAGGQAGRDRTGRDRMGSLPRPLHTGKTIASQFFQEAVLLRDSAIPFLPAKCFFSFIAC